MKIQMFLKNFHIESKTKDKAGIINLNKYIGIIISIKCIFLIKFRYINLYLYTNHSVQLHKIIGIHCFIIFAYFHTISIVKNLSFPFLSILYSAVSIEVCLLSYANTNPNLQMAHNFSCPSRGNSYDSKKKLRVFFLIFVPKKQVSQLEMSHIWQF